MTWYTLDQLETRVADLRREAAGERLARVAACCRPSTWAAWLHRIAQRLHHPRPCCP